MMFEVIAVDRGKESTSQRLRRHLLGGLVFFLGAGILLVFTYAMIVELKRGTFYGLSLCILLLTFGALLLRDGISLLVNLRLRLRDVDGK